MKDSIKGTITILPQEKHPWIGRKFMIYEDPITREKLEGEATIVTVYDIMHSRKGRLCSVCFTQDDPYDCVVRWVNVGDLI